MKNPLDEIAGIGPARKRALLLHFGTVKAIQRAKLDDLERTPGVNAATAKAVHDYFHDEKRVNADRSVRTRCGAAYSLRVDAALAACFGGSRDDSSRRHQAARPLVACQTC